MHYIVTDILCIPISYSTLWHHSFCNKYLSHSYFCHMHKCGNVVFKSMNLKWSVNICRDIPNISKHVHSSLSDRATEPIGCPSKSVFRKHVCLPSVEVGTDGRHGSWCAYGSSVVKGPKIHGPIPQSPYQIVLLFTASFRPHQYSLFRSDGLFLIRNVWVPYLEENR